MSARTGHHPRLHL